MVKTCILWLSLSVTISLPRLSRHTLAGLLNWPGLVPSVPNLLWNVPSLATKLVLFQCQTDH